MGYYHLDQHTPSQNRSEYSPLQKVEAEKTDQSKHEQSTAQVAKSFTGLLGSFDESEDLEEIMSLNIRRDTMKM